MSAPMMEVDGFIHIAEWHMIGARDKSPSYRINVGGTRNVLELI